MLKSKYLRMYVMPTREADESEDKAKEIEKNIKISQAQ